ncbi:MAG: ABC transporter permease, partial [Candidatus Eisenbacteria bacterium]
MIRRLAWRSVWRNRRRTIITVVSIGFGLAFAVILIALGEGMYEQMIDNALRMQAGHINIEHPEYRAAPAVDLFVELPPGLRERIDAMREVESARSIVSARGVARTGRGSVGVLILGVEPANERATSPVARHIVKGEYLDPEDGGRVVIGRDLADQLEVDLGEKLVLSANDAEGNLREELCRVRGIFRTGVDEVDGYILQVDIDFARRLLSLPEGSATEVAVLLENPEDQAKVLGRIRSLLEGARSSAVALPWEKVLADLAAYIKVDRASNWIFQGLLIVIVLFTIFNTILMSVLERGQEFAVILALGTPPRMVERQVMTETVFL